MRGFFLTYIYINILINLSNMLKTFFLFISLIFIYSCSTNFEPSIKSLSAEPNPSPPGEIVSLHCIAIDDDEPNLLKNEFLNYTWHTSFGEITVSDAPEKATWMAPLDTGRYSISCEVSDQYNGAAIITVEIVVQ